MGMAAGGGSGFQSEINVTPMVDIMLVLLIIFMVVTPLLQHGVTVALPKDLQNPEEDQRITSDNSIVISVVLVKSPNNPNITVPGPPNYFLGKDKMEKVQIKDKVQKMLDNIKNPEDKIVYIKSDIGVDYGDVVNVINEVRALGVDKIGLVADKKKGDGAAAPVPAPNPA